MATLTFHGHSCFHLVTDEGTRILFDPWLDENPQATISADEVGELDYILVTHGHFDHYADCLAIANRTGAQVISSFEVVSHLAGKGYENGHGMNIGGSYGFPFGRVKATIAHHTGFIEEGFYAAPCGFLLHLKGGQRLYHAGDTALTMDMQLLRGKVDVALLPIGDNFTMDPEDAGQAVEFIQPKSVIPMHYGTFPPIEVDPQDFVRAVGDRARVQVMEPGDVFDF
jgi:L-ascorbate metabolism protein UlaG (beta-lactamase superfamily)